MKGHAVAGEEALMAVVDQIDDVELLRLGLEVAGGHHEKWNGKGYPRGLSGTDIPLSARIVAVADVFDALMSKRVYKDAMPLEQVRGILLEGAGEHFDPQLIDAYQQIEDELVGIHRRLADVTAEASPEPLSQLAA